MTMPMSAPAVNDTRDWASASFLELDNLVTGFGAHAVLHGVNVQVRSGEIAGIFGLNGAGKSVTMKVVAGLVPAWRGTVRLGGLDITGDSAERRVVRGIGNVPQGRQVFAELTVEQNLRLGAYQLRRRNRQRYDSVLQSVFERFPVLAARRNQVAGMMSGGEQASLAVARALMSEPKLLLIDEPSAGLAPLVVEELFHTLAELNRTGLTILLVEQNVTFGLKLVHTAHLMRAGRVVYSGSSSSLDRERVAAELGIGRLLSLRSVGSQRAKRVDEAEPTLVVSNGTDDGTDDGTPTGQLRAVPDVEPRRFALKSGSVAAEISGSPTGRLVVGIPGLSANLRSFDVVYSALDPAVHRRLAFDPRGRGQSDKTPAGSYGWPAHARDVLELVDELGHEQFDLVGWSFGTWVAMTVCRMVPERVRRLVLIDGGGIPDESSIVPIYAGLNRLGTVYPSRQQFMDLLRSSGVYEPWEAWSPLFEYELEDVDGGGVRARTSAEACWEDERYRVSNFSYDLWDAVQVPSLLLRATNPIPGGEGYILNEADAERFHDSVARSSVVQVDAQHYTIGMHRDTARHIAEFLDVE
ncbi:MAG: alpha/beta fold hydrolase [Acidimicrobiales bacterium]